MMQTLVKVIFWLITAGLLAVCAVIGDVRYYLTFKNNVGVRYGLKAYRIVPGIVGTIWALLFAGFEFITGLPVLCFIENSTHDPWAPGILFVYLLAIAMIISCYFGLCQGVMKLFASATLGRLIEQRQNNLADNMLRDEVMEARIKRELRAMDEVFVAQGLYKAATVKEAARAPK